MLNPHCLLCLFFLFFFFLVFCLISGKRIFLPFAQAMAGGSTTAGNSTRLPQLVNVIHFESFAGSWERWGFNWLPWGSPRLGVFRRTGGVFLLLCWNSLSFCGMVSTASFLFNWIDYFVKIRNKWKIHFVFHVYSIKNHTELHQKWRYIRNGGLEVGT